jgi:hypothetical protein
MITFLSVELDSNDAFAKGCNVEIVLNSFGTVCWQPSG